jgi:hypothetical protein
MKSRFSQCLFRYTLLWVGLSAVTGCSPSSEFAGDNPFASDTPPIPVIWVKCFAYLMEFPPDVNISQLEAWPQLAANCMPDRTVNLWNQNGFVLGLSDAESWSTLWGGLQKAGGKPLGEYSGIVRSREQVNEFEVRLLENPTTVFVTDGISRQPRGYTLAQGNFYLRLGFVPLNLEQQDRRISFSMVPVFKGMQDPPRLEFTENNSLRSVSVTPKLFFEQLVLNGTVNDKAIICIAPGNDSKNPGTLGHYFFCDEQKTPNTQIAVLLAPEVFTAYKTPQSMEQ